jgi:hypothetical protein
MERQQTPNADSPEDSSTLGAARSMFGVDF